MDNRLLEITEQNKNTRQRERTIGIRNHNIDFCRTLAIIFVVFNHVVETMYQLDSEYMNSISILSRSFAFSGFTLGRMGVPFFLFISGYLLLGKIYTAKECIKFWKKKLLPLLIITEIWNLLYNLFIAWFDSKPFDIILFVCNILFLKQVSLPHMWYMPMILGLYFFIPFLSNLICEIEDRVWAVVFIVMFFFGFWTTIIAHFYLVFIGQPLKMNTVTPSFLGGIYGIYLLVGYYVKKGLFNSIKDLALLIGGGTVYILTIVYQMWLYSKNVNYNVWYSCPLLFMCSIAIFIRLLRVNISNTNIEIVLEFVARHAFGIYLIHVLIMKVIKQNVVISGTIPVQCLVMWCIVFGLSLVTVVVLSRLNKSIGKWLFFVKPR